MAVYGYARVSTTDQSLDGQLADLKAAGCTKVFQEKITGKHRNRPQLDRLLRTLSEGDVLIVTRLDRLARSTRDLLNLVQHIADAGATFKSLADSWADTTTAHGRLMMTVLGGLAEFERELIVQRTGDGRIRAMANGIKFGRKPKLTHHQQREAIARRQAGETLVEIARSYAVHHTPDLAVVQWSGVVSLFLATTTDYTHDDLVRVVAEQLAEPYRQSDNLRTAVMYAPHIMSPAEWVAACQANGIKVNTARNRLSEVRRMQRELGELFVTVTSAVVYLVGVFLWTYAGLPVPHELPLSLVFLGSVVWALFVVWFWFCTRFPLAGVFVTPPVIGKPVYD